MGVKDLMSIYPIIQHINELERTIGWGYDFVWDQGFYETLIAINEETGKVRRPHSNETWDSITYPEQPFCPDIMDYSMKLIIEFEETEGKPRHGAYLAKKGHNADGLDKRTSNRDLFYSIGGFSVFKIFDFEKKEDYSKRLKQFLVDTYLKNSRASLEQRIK